LELWTSPPYALRQTNKAGKQKKRAKAPDHYQLQKLGFEGLN
jgi:hypothetical protein